MEVTPSIPSPKRARVSKAPEAAEAKPTTTKKPTARKQKAVAQAAAADIGGMVAVAAYFLAQHRNFEPGHELEDWLEAERQIKTLSG